MRRHSHCNWQVDQCTAAVAVVQKLVERLHMDCMQAAVVVHHRTVAALDRAVVQDKTAAGTAAVADSLAVCCSQWGTRMVVKRAVLVEVTVKGWQVADWVCSLQVRPLEW